VHVFLLSTMAGVTMSFHFVGNAAALPNNLVAGEVVKPDAAVNCPGKQTHKLSEVASTTTRNWLGFGFCCLNGRDNRSEPRRHHALLISRTGCETPFAQSSRCVVSSY
jgi:hypothetical protein